MRPRNRCSLGLLLALTLLGVGCTKKDDAVEGAGGNAAATGGAGGAQSTTTATGGTAGGTGGGGGVAVVIEDPAPFATSPGEVKACADAPDTDLSVFEYVDLEASTLKFEGTVAGATGAGTYYVVSGTQAISGPIPTEDGSGAFAVELPLFCGEQTVKLVWSNADCAVAAVTRVVRAACKSEDIRLTLTWDGLGSDFELHLIKQGGKINDPETDCTWTTCISASPDWGVLGDESDDPHKDVDNTEGFGPENIYLSKPEAGVYTVMVEHWGGGSPEADGQVIFNVAGKTTLATVSNLPSRSVWRVGTIEWPSGAVSVSETTYDCSSEWSSGCIATLP